MAVKSDVSRVKAMKWKRAYSCHIPRIEVHVRVVTSIVLGQVDFAGADVYLAGAKGNGNDAGKSGGEDNEVKSELHVD